MELMAKRHNDGVLKYAIERQFRNMVKNRTMDNGVQYERGMTNAFVWADDSIQPEEPGLLSCEVLDELVGKKAVFRDGWREDSTYLLYNYRDVGPYGKLTRDYLQNTIPVHAEKPHHGHADEQSICALCSGGAVLLRDGGLPGQLYHERPLPCRLLPQPSGDAQRADVPGKRLFGIC